MEVLYPDVVKYVSEQNDKRRVTVLFNEPGNHKVTLVVTDKYGQISEISKDVVVQSVLRPQLKATPRAAVWESYITFEAQVIRIFLVMSEIFERIYYQTKY